MKYYFSMLRVVIIILIMTVANLLFFSYNSYKLNLTMVTLLPIINAAYLIVTLSLNYYYSHKYIQQVVHQGKLNNILYNLVQQTSGNSSPRQLYSNILSSAVQAIPAANKGCILLLDKDGETLHFMAVEGYDEEVLFETFLDLKESYLYRESDGNITGSVVIDDPFGYDRMHIHSDNMDTILTAGSDNVMSTISTPIINDGKLYGMINVDSPERNVYTATDVDIIEVFAFEATNVIKLYQTLEENTYLSSHDILTGVYNRSYFNRYMETFINASNPTPFTLVSMDLNYLKKTNDSYGHSAGDQLLVDFTKGIARHLPRESCFSRYGGDEFLILLPNMTSADTSRLLQTIEAWFSDNPAIHEGLFIPIHFSYGMAESTGNSSHFSTILQQADNEMYQNKRAYHALHRE